jgi:hypothetical protein
MSLRSFSLLSLSLSNKQYKQWPHPAAVPGQDPGCPFSDSSPTTGSIQTPPFFHSIYWGIMLIKGVVREEKGDVYQHRTVCLCCPPFRIQVLYPGVRNRSEILVVQADFQRFPQN